MRYPPLASLFLALSLSAGATVFTGTPPQPLTERGGGHLIIKPTLIHYDDRLWSYGAKLLQTQAGQILMGGDCRLKVDDAFDLDRNFCVEALTSGPVQRMSFHDEHMSYRSFGFLLESSNQELFVGGLCGAGVSPLCWGRGSAQGNALSWHYDPQPNHYGGSSYIPNTVLTEHFVAAAITSTGPNGVGPGLAWYNQDGSAVAQHAQDPWGQVSGGEAGRMVNGLLPWPGDRLIALDDRGHLFGVDLLAQQQQRLWSFPEGGNQFTSFGPQTLIKDHAGRVIVAGNCNRNSNGVYSSDLCLIRVRPSNALLTPWAWENDPDFNQGQVLLIPVPGQQNISYYPRQVFVQEDQAGRLVIGVNTYEDSHYVLRLEANGRMDYRFNGQNTPGYVVLPNSDFAPLSDAQYPPGGVYIKDLLVDQHNDIYIASSCRKDVAAPVELPQYPNPYRPQYFMCYLKIDGGEPWVQPEINLSADSKVGLGETIEFTVMLRGYAPTGTVTIKENEQTICHQVPLKSATLQVHQWMGASSAKTELYAQANCSSVATSLGLHQYTVTYSGDAHNAPSQASEFNHGWTEVETESCASDNDSDGLPNCEETRLGLNPNSKDNQLLANTPLGHQLFVLQSFRDLLRVNGKSTAVANWAEAMNRGLSPAALTQGFLSSKIAENEVQPIARLLLAYFGTMFVDGQNDMLNAAIKEVSVHGRSLEQLSHYLADSPALLRQYGTLSDRDLVRLIYQNGLGRTASEDELQQGLAQIRTLNRGAWVLSIMQSDEAIRRHANRVYVGLVMSGMGQKAPTSSGEAYWLNKLQANPSNGRSELVQAYMGELLPQYGGAALAYHNRFLPTLQ